MYKKALLIIILSALVGCSGHLRESSFITQDEAITEYQDLALNKWQASFSQHKLTSLTLVTEIDNVTLKGIFLDSPTSQDVIFYIQGNGMRVSDGGIYALKALAKLGKDIVIFDRRGLGASSGKATILNLGHDSIEQYRFIKDTLKAKSIIVHGYSLGSFIAGHLAKNETVDALVLQGSATNVDDWIDKKTPWYTKPFLTIEVDDAFNTVDNEVVVSNFYRGPLLVIGAENDEQVPVELSSALYNASKSENKKLVIVEGADHGSMLDKPKEIALYKQFINSIK
jgi:pimeloyl-ACP methyl ester carboxylesterase